MLLSDNYFFYVYIYPHNTYQQRIVPGQIITQKWPLLPKNDGKIVFSQLLIESN